MAGYLHISQAIHSFLATARHPWRAEWTGTVRARAGLSRKANGRGMRPLNGDSWHPPADDDGVDERLRPLADRYRSVSLADAPLGERIAALLPLHEADPDNPVWIANLRRLGAARLQTARAEARAAYRNRDLPALERLSAELTGHAADLGVPDDLCRDLERAIAAIKLANAREQLKNAFLDLRAARAAADVARGSAALRRWTEVVEAQRVPLPAPVEEAIRPLAEWVRREQRRQAQRERLKELVPTLLETERRFRAARRRLRILVGVLALAILAALATLAYLYIPGIGRP